MGGECTIFRVQQSGPMTVLGFGEDGLPNHFYHSECLDELDAVIARYGCDTIVFDFSCVRFLAGGLAGLLQWLVDRGIHVRILNATSIIRNALRLIRLEFDSSND